MGGFHFFFLQLQMWVFMYKSPSSVEQEFPFGVWLGMELLGNMGNIHSALQNDAVISQCSWTNL